MKYSEVEGDRFGIRVESLVRFKVMDQGLGFRVWGIVRLKVRD